MKNLYFASQNVYEPTSMKSIDPNLIYIVDDDPDDRQVILDAFLENDATIKYAFIENGQELLANLYDTDGHYPEIILLDLNMHKLTGLQALKEIRTNQQFNQIPVIVLTTSTHHSDKRAAYELGANCYLNKPQTYSGLIEMSESIRKLFMKGGSQ
jgi:CheY-like chemotaxis protein